VSGAPAAVQQASLTQGEGARAQAHHGGAIGVGGRQHGRHRWRQLGELTGGHDHQVGAQRLLEAVPDADGEAVRRRHRLGRLGGDHEVIDGQPLVGAVDSERLAADAELERVDAGMPGKIRVTTLRSAMLPVCRYRWQ